MPNPPARESEGEVEAVAKAICEALANWLDEPLHEMTYQDSARAAIRALDRVRGEMTLDSVIEAVRADLLSRSQKGIQKYGITLGDHQADERTKLQHAYEEALDLANYLKWRIMELDEIDRARKGDQ